MRCGLFIHKRPKLPVDIMDSSALIKYVVKKKINWFLVKILNIIMYSLHVLRRSLSRHV